MYSFLQKMPFMMCRMSSDLLGNKVQEQHWQRTNSLPAKLAVKRLTEFRLPATGSQFDCAALKTTAAAASALCHAICSCCCKETHSNVGSY
jgi:hypothetical protein